MHSRIYRPLATAAILAALTAIPASAALPDKPLAPNEAHVRLTVKPGQVLRWRSPNIGPVDRLSLDIAGRHAFYQAEPKTRNCVAYGYEAGVAVRLTDCVKGQRVPYVRLRATSAALKPVTLTLWLN